MNSWLMFRDPQRFVVELVVIVLSIALHEFGHAISADRLGDDTPRRQGRVTLWPDKHLDPFGFLMMFITINTGFGIGWGKPVQVNFRGMRHPRRDMLIVSACGPLMNLFLATIAGLVLRIGSGHGAAAWFYAANGKLSVSALFAIEFLFINLGLMFFNLIPIHPLDGGKILSSLLPPDQAIVFDRFVGQYGGMLLLALVFLAPQVLGGIIGPAIETTARFIAGPTL